MPMKRPTVTFSAYDVVVVPFPFTDRDAEKRRPALVLSSTAFGKRIGHSVMAMITSDRGVAQRWPLDVPIRELAAAGLPAPSLVRMKLFTLDHRLVIRRAGRLAETDCRVVRKALAELFGD